MENIKVQLTKNPKAKPADETSIGFGSIFTDHMFVMDYDEKNGWNFPRIVPYAPITLEPSAMCLHYGQMVFEGLKAYRADDGRILLFRPEKNFERLNKSCERLCIPKLDEKFLLYSLKELIKLEKDWVPSAKNTSLYIRPFIISTQPSLGVRPSSTYQYIVILSPSGPYYSTGLNPVKIYVEDIYVRAVKGGMGMAKTGGNYAGSLKSQEEAHSKSYSQTLWLDGVERKYVEEVGAMNIFFVVDDEVITPMLSGSILEGVTRSSVIEILKEQGIKVSERKISIQEISDAYDKGSLKEVFGTGTAAVISPVGELRWEDKAMVINGGNIGEISQRLYSELTAIQWGRKKDLLGWSVEVCTTENVKFCQ